MLIHVRQYGDTNHGTQPLPFRNIYTYRDETQLDIVVWENRIKCLYEISVGGSQKWEKNGAPRKHHGGSEI